MSIPLEMRSITWTVNSQVHAADETSMKSISDRDPSFTVAFRGRCKQNEAALEFLINENEKNRNVECQEHVFTHRATEENFILPRLRFFFLTVIWLGQTCKGNYAASSCVCVCFNENMFHGSSLHSIRNRRGSVFFFDIPFYQPSSSLWNPPLFKWIHPRNKELTRCGEWKKYVIMWWSPLQQS